LAVKSLPVDVKIKLNAHINSAKSKSCDLLNDKKCLIYADRPVICRTHGYPLLADGKAVYCQNNFKKSPPPEDKADLLPIERINTALAAICVEYQRQNGKKTNTRRISIRSVIKKALN
jgi:Fe-S-cluster containining protein